MNAVTCAGPPSRKIADSPGASAPPPFSATALAKLNELSSIFQVERSADTVPVLVTSNQSAATGLLPLDQGATSVMRTTGSATSATLSVKLVLASGVEPTLASSTLTVTA